MVLALGGCFIVFLEDSLLSSLVVLLVASHLLFQSLTHCSCYLSSCSILSLLLTCLVAVVGSIVEVFNEFLYLLLGLLLCDLLLEVEDDVVAVPHLLEREEVVEEVLQLVHALVQKLVRCIAEGLLWREVGEPIVSLQVKLGLE